MPRATRARRRGAGGARSRLIRYFLGSPQTRLGLIAACDQGALHGALVVRGDCLSRFCSRWFTSHPSC